MAHSIPGLKCTFIAQGWAKGGAYEVPNARPKYQDDTWHVDLFEVYELTGHAMTEDGYPNLDNDPYQRDELRNSKSAPQWVKDWDGPFEVEWEIVDSVPGKTAEGESCAQTKLYAIDVEVVATAYVKAKSHAEAAAKVRDLNGNALEVQGGIVDGRDYAALMEDDSVSVTLSPAMSICGQADDEIEVAWPPVLYYVEGALYNDPDSDLASDGNFPPFYVFDVVNQCHLAGPFSDPKVAQKALNAFQATSGKTVEAFEPSLVTIKRKRFSVTQGHVSLFYNGEPIGDFGDQIELNGDGEWRGRTDAYWIDVARRRFNRNQEA